MIAATLVVIAIVIVLLFKNQTKLHEEKTRAQGVALTRTLSGAEYSQLVPGTGQNSLIRSLVNVQGNENFAYAVVVNLAGTKLYETTSAGSITPVATMPTEPYSWFGEHNVISPGDGRKIREFFAPVMKDGQLAGFIRAGYYNRQATVMSNQISTLGLMALPIFLLTTLSYFLIRRETKPLGQLSKKLEQALLSYGFPVIRPAHGQDLADFIQRFDQFMKLVQSRVHDLNKESLSSRTGAHLITYKQEKAESALNSIPDGVLVIDNACVPTFANAKLEPILGVSHTEIIGRQPEEWCKNKEILAFLLRFRSSPSAKHSANIEYVPEGKPDQRISVAAYPLFSPRDQTTLFGMLIIFRDTSKEYFAKQAGAEFVSHVSHELKTPLNTLAAYSELLLDHASITEAEQVEAVNVIHDEVERMTGLINNLLNISKMDTGTLQLVRKRVKLHDLMQDAFDSMSNNALGKGVELELKIPPDLGSVRLDKDLFRVAIDNLLSNAIKYSNPGGKVTVSAQNLDNDQMQISVRDRGIGISPEDCEKVFLKYYRANNSETGSRSGHGLGLYLARQIVSLHHGTLTVNSEPGKGSEFIITFKAQPVQLEESQD
jgi:signal transduction histidine kinase